MGGACFQPSERARCVGSPSGLESWADREENVLEQNDQRGGNGGPREKKQKNQTGTPREINIRLGRSKNVVIKYRRKGSVPRRINRRRKACLKAQAFGKRLERKGAGSVGRPTCEELGARKRGDFVGAQKL